MTTYYEILGLEQGAGSADIKAAFRGLAKIYHPDKNPEDKERFELILKAYETLSDPYLRSSYDYRIKYQLHYTNTVTPKKTNTKNWSFDEKEMKRRKYYDEYIKKHEKSGFKGEEELVTKKNYNEFKYILYATPLAVILFLLIVNLSTSPANNQPQEEEMPRIMDSIKYTPKN